MKRKIRLTENDLHRIVKESVKRIIREAYTDDDSLMDDMAFYNIYGNQSQYPANDGLEPFEGELAMTAQYDDDEYNLAMQDPEYFFDGKDEIYRSKMPGDYRTKKI